jgi:hypothetical protein
MIRGQLLRDSQSTNDCIKIIKRHLRSFSHRNQPAAFETTTRIAHQPDTSARSVANPANSRMMICGGRTVATTPQWAPSQGNASASSGASNPPFNFQWEMTLFFQTPFRDWWPTSPVRRGHFQIEPGFDPHRRQYPTWRDLENSRSFELDPIRQVCPASRTPMPETDDLGLLPAI